MTDKNNEINFLNFKTILVLSNTNSRLVSLENLLDNKIKKIDFNNEIMSVEELILYDLIIIDLNYFDFNNINIIYERYGIDIPIICINSSFDENIMQITKNTSVKNILIEEVQLEQIYLYIILALNERKKLQLEDYYSYDLQTAKLFYKLQEIKLTRYEAGLLKVLILNKNTILSYEEIESRVWGEKKCSIYSMRNIVNKIRDKSFPSIIKNISKTGYLFDHSEYY
jgi:DNA-binding response OmpR family regulator